MRRTWYTAAGLGFLVGISGPAAADGYTRGSVKDPPVGVYNWSGFYTGAHVGYGWSDAGTSIAAGDAAANAFLPFFPATGTPTSVSQDQRGFLSGALGGYNIRSGNTVWGVESDISIGSVKDRDNVPSAVGVFSTNVESKVDWLSTLRLRGGLLVTPQALLYVTGGLAYGHVEHSYALAITGAGINFFSGRTSGTEVGWTAGGGVEFAISPRMTLRGEYLYYDLGDTKFATTGLPGIGTFNVTAENTGHIARAALSYKY
jgi:outer membrane immunogenic protein